MEFMERVRWGIGLMAHADAAGGKRPRGIRWLGRVLVIHGGGGVKGISGAAVGDSSGGVWGVERWRMRHAPSGAGQSVQAQGVEAADGAVAGGAAGAGVAVLLDADLAVEEVQAGQHHAVALDLRRRHRQVQRPGSANSRVRRAGGLQAWQHTALGTRHGTAGGLPRLQPRAPCLCCHTAAPRRVASHSPSGTCGT